ncbi:serine-rich and transmembrane domain-containing protein 1 isoform X1 [Coturnix japonica]|uniref:serine-rich and transmembrane domain-containing protein 1 isoform X1 n=1 Tax=Coturnix japonica TaxID=93934 RepID=UPI0007774E7D|nr:serine-rich and transmembrane domain-containing protein 1 isoform X1 [Coturnix japonica]
MMALVMTYIQKPAEQKDFGQSARGPRIAPHPPPPGAGAEAGSPLLRFHRTAPGPGAARGQGTGEGRARGGAACGAARDGGGSGAGAGQGWPRRKRSRAEPGARGFSQHAVPLDLAAITNHIRHIGFLACILLLSCFSEEHAIPLPWAWAVKGRSDRWLTCYFFSVMEKCSSKTSPLLCC